MPIESYFDQKEPASQDAEIWRFMPLERFQDFVANEELYFCRSDLFSQDDEEGIPPEEYLRLIMGSQRYVLDDEKELNHQIGSLAQMREMYFVNCWHLFRQEKPAMWDAFGKGGVAIRSRYDLLKTALDGMLDRTYLGLVQYGDRHLTATLRMNVLQFITTKRADYADECEVRAFLECTDPFAGHNLHFDENNWPHRRPLPENEQYRHHWVHGFKRRRVALQKLIIGVVVSPKATKQVFDEVELWKRTKGFSFEVRVSDLA